MTPRLKIDLLEDWIEVARATLVGRGHSIPAGTNPDEVRILHASMVHRLVGPGPRKVVFSHEFSRPPEVTAGLALFVYKAQHGGDLNPHLGKPQKRPNSELPNLNDPLLNDWKIHHFHLGLYFESGGYIDRTGPVLFARVEADTVYCIDIMEHGRGHRPWAKQKLARIVRDNWPQLLTPLPLYPPDRGWTDGQIYDLRKRGLTTFLLIDDTVYAPPGGGVATSGTSTRAVRRAGDRGTYFRRAEAWVRDNLAEIVERARAKGFAPRDEYHLRLGFKDKKPFAVEESMGFGIALPLE